MNVGDFGFFEYRLSQIKEIDDNGHPTHVSDGYFEHIGLDLSDRWFPVSLRIKNISECFAKFSQKIHESDFNSLNYPDIARYLVSQWVDACEGDDGNFKKVYDETNKFVEDVLDYCNSTKQLTINGVRVIGR